LTTKDNLLIRGLKSAEERVKKFGQMTANVGLKMAAVGGGLLSPITKVFAESASRASEIKTLSDRYGVAADKVSSLAYAFERNGVSLDEFGGTLDTLQAKMFSAADGADDTFRRLGINARAFTKLPLDKQLETLIDRINNLADPMDRAAVGAEFFGASWNKIANGAGSSVKALRALQEEAHKAGAVLNDQQAEEGQRTVRAFTASWQALKYAVLEVGTALFPQVGHVENLADAIRGAAGAARDWIARNRGIIVAVTAVGAAIVAGGVALFAFGKACVVLGATIGGVVAALGLVGTALSFLLTPFGLVLAAVVGLTAAWLTLTESGKRFASTLTTAFAEVGRIFAETWSGIVAAIGKGDLELAGKIAMAGLKAAWAETMVFLTEKWVDFKNLVVDGWHELGDLFENAAVGWGALIEHIRTGSFAAGEKYAQETQQQIENMRRDRNKDNRKFRDQQIDDAKAERDRLRAELAALNARASVPGKTGKTPGEIEQSMWNPAKPGAAPLAPPLELFQNTKGTFSSSNLSGMLGVGNNVGQRQLQTQQQIRDRIDKTNALLAKLGIATFK